MKEKTIFVCADCGHSSAKWLGQCPSCRAWNTMQEEVVAEAPAKSSLSAKKNASIKSSESSAVSFNALELPAYMRLSSGQPEFDRVLGGGIVHGSVTLVAGEPGIGKSTLLLQISAAVASVSDFAKKGESGRKVMYVSGEESQWQLKYRAKRLGVAPENLLVLTETNLDAIFAELDCHAPVLVVVDSIQTIFDDRLTSAPGSVMQVRECANRIIAKAKSDGISVILVGHVNKEGGIAGPKVLEHMVDAVVYFEGDRLGQYRIVRATKNRYGPTGEIGVFAMTERGMEGVENPSEMLLSDRPRGISGNCAVCVMEGSRPIIAEIQALVTPTVYPSPKRTANGIDYNRLGMLLAVLEKRLGLRFSANDVYVNVVGGLRLDEPASDLAVCMALISSIRDLPLSEDLIAVGEIGLAGECRTATDVAARVAEAARVGFKRVIIPKNAVKSAGKKLEDSFRDVEIIRVKALYDAIKQLN